jgi:hypothetical protein
MLVATSIAVSTSDSATFGSGIPGGGHAWFWKRR